MLDDRSHRDALHALLDFHVEDGGGEIAGLAPQEGDDFLDEAQNLRRGGRFHRSGKPPGDAAAGLGRILLRQLQAGDAALAPNQSTIADRRAEERKGLGMSRTCLDMAAVRRVLCLVLGRFVMHDSNLGHLRDVDNS